MTLKIKHMEENNYHLEHSYFKAPLYLEGILVYQIGRRYCKENSVVAPHVHADLYELTIVTSGGGEIITNGVPTEVKRGDIYLSMPCDAHEIRSGGEEPLKYDFFAFTCENEDLKSELEYIMENYYSPTNRVFRDERVRQMIGDAIAELNGERLFTEELLAALFRQIVIYTIRGFRQIAPDKQLDTVTFAEILCYRLMNYIDTHVYSMKNLEELSEVTGYSYGYLSALFKKTTSQTLAHYYYEKKLDVARLLILEERFTITEISEMLNYASVYSFSKAFHKRFGASPRIYRSEGEHAKKY